MLRKTFATRHILAAASVAMTLLCSAPAQAGTVRIKSCGDAAVGAGADSAWQLISDNSGGYEAPTRVCPSTGVAVGTDLDHNQILGRSVWTKLSSGVAPQAGEKAEMRFTAPTGTRITAVTISRDIGLRSDGYYVYGRTDAGQLTGETCARSGGEWGCNLGGYGSVAVTLTGLDAAWIAWGFQCGANGFLSCGTGISLHQAWAHIYASTVTLTDNQVPTGVAAGGAVATAGWKGGTVGGTISGSDNLGVQKLRWYADGDLVSTSADRACDFSVTVPCSDAAGAAYALDTTALADGRRSIQAAVVDPAGNEARSTPFDVDVDNTAPPAPSSLQVSGGGASPAFSMSWLNPAPDGGSPYVSSRWQACAAGTCSTGTGALTSASGTLPPAAGAYTVKVWLVDEAGNGSAAASASAGLTYSPPAAAGGRGGGGGGGPARTTPAPADPAGASPVAPIELHPDGPAPRPADGGALPVPAAPPTTGANVRISSASMGRSGRLVVRGTIARRATGSVTVTYRGTVRGKARSRATRARIRSGRYAAHLRIPRRWLKARDARVTVRYAGSRAVHATTRTVAVTR